MKSGGETRMRLKKDSVDVYQPVIGCVNCNQYLDASIYEMQVQVTKQVGYIKIPMHSSY